MERRVYVQHIIIQGKDMRQNAATNAELVETSAKDNAGMHNTIFLLFLVVQL